MEFWFKVASDVKKKELLKVSGQVCWCFVLRKSHFTLGLHNKAILSLFSAEKYYYQKKNIESNDEKRKED